MRYYPIGTVVTLINGNVPLMIYGRKQLQEEHDFIWDYVACLYPLGHVDDECNVFFQHEEVDKVYYYGLICELEEELQLMLNIN